MNTLVLSVISPNPVAINDTTKVSSLSEAAVTLKRSNRKFRQAWTIQSTVQDKEEFKRMVLEFYAQTRGDSFIWFDGLGLGDIDFFVKIGEGDGVNTVFEFPIDHVFAPSLVVKVGASVVTNWTLQETPAILSLGTPPGDKIPVFAKWRGKKKVYISAPPGGEQIMDFFQFGIGLQEVA